MRSAAARILPDLNTTIWGYDGTFPGPTIEARSGRRISLRLQNRLPVPIVNHLHGGRNAPASDGYPTDLILPANGAASGHVHDALANVVTGEREYVYENVQRAATLWYHDHRMDFTAPQVWRGLAGFYLIRDDEEDRLQLPRGDRETPLLICDRSFDADGSLRYPALDSSLQETPGVQAEYMGGVLGDVILVNGAPWPRMEVANVKYRFRILNASNARRYELALDPSPPGTAFLQIGSDGGLLEMPVAHRTLRIAPAERFDVVVDFSRFQPGTSILLVNQAGTGSTARIMRFDINRRERDESVIPTRLSEMTGPRTEEASVTRDFDFSFQRFQHGWTINGKPFDPARMDARPRLNATEIWRLHTDFSHPLHLHLVHFRILSHSGRPAPYDVGWKDTIDLGPGQSASILVRFTGYRGRYVFHCHNLEHEDMSMMGNFEVI
ncbi:MAG TPA: multicopper oxidase family protein [Bryobacteraceae bacterium]|nr:multicopper oxidase family protein [Bryobacteraceae bacterium]